MNQSERRIYLLRELLKEDSQFKGSKIPASANMQKRLLRSLMNVRQAAPISEEFEKVQDAYLKELNEERGIVELDTLTPVRGDLYLWQGDITTLKVGAIVNAANSQMTGCYIPMHICIDNCIHTFAGIQLRNYCDAMMKEQGHLEETGRAKVTPAFNLPCKYVIHTVGPIVYEELTEEEEGLLASCYQSCLEAADEVKAESIAFCCISTGVFRFPADRAAQIAVKTVEEYKEKNGSKIKVIFNVFKDEDLKIYQDVFK